MADKFNLSESDLKTLKIFSETLKSIISDFNQGSKAVAQMEQNFFKVSRELKIFAEHLNKGQREKIEEIKIVKGATEAIDEYRERVKSLSKQVAKDNSKYINSGVEGATIDLAQMMSTSNFEKVILSLMKKSITSVVPFFAENLSVTGQKALTKILQSTTSISHSTETMQQVKDAVDKIRRENHLITEEIKVQQKQIEKTVVNKKKTQKNSEETLAIEKKITKEKQKQVSAEEQVTKKRRGRPKKVQLTEVSEAPSVQNALIPYKMGSVITRTSGGLIPHPTLFKYPSTSLVPTGKMGSASIREERIELMKLRQYRDSMKVAGRGIVNMGSEVPPRLGIPMSPVAGLLPLHTDEEFDEISKRAHLNNISRSDRPIQLGEVEPVPVITRDLKAQKRRIKARQKRDKDVLKNMGSKKPITLGTSESSFREQQQREEDSKNRRAFVMDLATAILNAQKKNPIKDLLKLAILIMGKHLPVLSAALLTLVPLMGIFKGARILKEINALVTGTRLPRNASTIAKLWRSFSKSNSLKGLAGFGPNSWVTQLTKKVPAIASKTFKQTLGKSTGVLAHMGAAGKALYMGGAQVAKNFGRFQVVKEGGKLIQNVAKMGANWISHPKGMSRLTSRGASALLKGGLGLGGKALLGAAKFGFRGLASPLMMAIDGISGFMDTKGGKWWQRVLGVLLKILTLGFMSGKKIREIVGMKETELSKNDKRDSDEERRHQERIGWWDKFWAWLKGALPWIKDDPKNGSNTTAPILGAADTDSAIKDSLEEKKRLLDSDKFKVGSKEYNKAITEYKKEYAAKETAGYWSDNKSYNRAYKAKLNSDEAQQYATNRLANDAKALRNDIKNTELVLRGGVTTTGVSATSSGGKFGKGTFAGHNVTSSFGKRNTGIAGASKNHKGIDLDYSYENVGAFAAGKVIFAGQQKDRNGKLTGYGNYVVVQDAGGMKHTYGHLSKISVRKGQQVALGQSIGVSGNSGTSGGAHLHYGVQDKNNNFLNPLAVASSSAKDYMEALKKSDIAAETNTISEVNTKEKEQATSDIRTGLAELVGAKNKSAKQDRARNIVLSAVDVTGSLGVWGITQLNNGVMRTGR